MDDASNGSNSLFEEDVFLYMPIRCFADVVGARKRHVSRAELRVLWVTIWAANIGLCPGIPNTILHPEIRSLIESRPPCSRNLFGTESSAVRPFCMGYLLIHRKSMEIGLWTTAISHTCSCAPHTHFVLVAGVDLKSHADLVWFHQILV